MHCLVGIALLSYYPFPFPSQRLCALVGAWEQKALSDSLPASQTGVKVRVTFRSSASSSMHQSSGERRRLACHTDRLRVTLAGRAGTLVKARGAAGCEKGGQMVSFTLPVTLLSGTVKGRSRLVGGRCRGRGGGLGMSVCCCTRSSSCPRLAGKSLAVRTAVRLQGIARLLIIWC